MIFFKNCIDCKVREEGCHSICELYKKDREVFEESKRIANEKKNPVLNMSSFTWNEKETRLCARKSRARRK